MLRSYHFCNNCGKQGHLFNQCKKPITSIGIVAFKIENGAIKYLLICRKDSLGYVDFVRGKYPLYNREYIQNLINEMTESEKSSLVDQTFSEVWTRLWGDYIGLQYRGEERNSEEKFKQIHRGIQMYNGEGYSLATLLANSDTQWDTPEWGFPKGRRNYQENDLTCALREFEEETGYSQDDLSVLKNVVPVEEIFTGSNFKSYRHRYYLGCMKSDVRPTTDFQQSEVSDRQWMTLDECLQRIRPYNLEKRQLITDIDKILHRYRLIS